VQDQNIKNLSRDQVFAPPFPPVPWFYSHCISHL
jgi:hypothetical protein